MTSLSNEEKDRRIIECVAEMATVAQDIFNLSSNDVSYLIKKIYDAISDIAMRRITDDLLHDKT